MIFPLNFFKPAVKTIKTEVDDLTNIMLNKRSQTQKCTYFTVLLMYNSNAGRIICGGRSQSSGELWEEEDGDWKVKEGFWDMITLYFLTCLWLHCYVHCEYSSRYL